MTISERLFSVMKEKDITAYRLSRMTGISRQTINDWRVKNTNPGADKILLLCEALEITPQELLAGKKEPVCPADGSSGQNSERREPTLIDEPTCPTSGMPGQNSERPEPTLIDENSERSEPTLIDENSERSEPTPIDENSGRPHPTLIDENSEQPETTLIEEERTEGGAPDADAFVMDDGCLELITDYRALSDRKKRRLLAYLNMLQSSKD